MARFDFLNKMDEGNNVPSPTRRRRRWALTLVAVAIGASILYNGASEYLAPYEVGVKQSRYGGGIDPEPYYGPGLYFTGPGVTFFKFPLVVQTLTMNSGDAEASMESADSRSIRSLEVDSLDGSKIRIDASILYRIVDPMKVHTRIGPGRLFEDNAIIPKSSQALKQSLGKLKAEDFYNELLRVQATEAARVTLNKELEELGLSVDHILIRQYYYLAEYQSQIEERKVQDQLVYTNQSMGEAAKMEVLRKKIDAEGNAAVGIEKQRGSAEVAAIKAEADLYVRKRKAEGDLAVSLARAQGTELENAAYKASSGSDNLVGLEMADTLKGVDVIFLEGGKDGSNLLDISSTLKMFDVEN